MNLTQENLAGTPIPKVSKELFRQKTSNDVFAQTKVKKKLIKIIADTKLGDDRGDVCTDPTHNHPKEWHHGISYPESGGVFVYHLSFPYPEKGTRDDFMMMSIQFVKRMFINWLKFATYKYVLPAYLIYLFTPWKIRIKVFEKFLEEFLNYANFVDEVAQHFVLEPRYYSAQGRELMKGIEIFLKGIGISDELSFGTALMFIALIDNDTAYYYRIADILSETDKVTMLRDPAKEIQFLMNTFAEREGRPRLVKHFNIFGKAIKVSLWSPRIRRAFYKAINEMDFSKLGLDEADRYHVRNMGGYNYFGRTQEDRLKEWPFTTHTLAELEWKQ